MSACCSCSQVRATTCLIEVFVKLALFSRRFVSIVLIQTSSLAPIEFQDILLLTTSTETAHVHEGHKWFSYDDFLGLVAYRMYDETSQEDLLKAFDAFDDSSDGVLDAGEMREVIADSCAAYRQVVCFGKVLSCHL